MKALACALAAWCVVAWAPPAQAADPRPPSGTAVFPFPDRRQPGQQDWLGAFLRAGIEDALLRSGRMPLLGDDAARIWAMRYGPVPQHAGGKRLTPQRVREAGLAFAVRGTTQRVVNQAVVWLELVAQPPGAAPGAAQSTAPAGGAAEEDTASTEPESGAPAPGPLTPGAATWELRIDLGQDSPQQALDKVLVPLFKAMGLEAPPSAPPQPGSWDAAQGFYGASPAIVPGRPPEVAAERDQRLAEAQRDPALRGKALARLAQLRLEQARVDMSDETRRDAALREALRMATESAKLDPWDARRLSLKAELHYFLKQDFEARQEANVARLRNPLDGLAYAVLALVAGLSTAEGGDMMRQALAADPFLRANARPAGWPPFQRGAMQPFVARFDELTKQGDRFDRPEFENQIALGKRLYEAQQWQEASEAFVAAEAMETDSHLPRLYLARIRMDSGDPAGAMEDLRILAGEYPQEAEVWHAYGLTLEAGGQYIEAEEAFRRALEERPDEPNALYHLALSQAARENWGDARNTLRILTERNTRHGQGWLLLGTAELQLENYRDAHAAFRQALQVDPQNEKARAGMKLAVEKAKAAQDQQQQEER